MRAGIESNVGVRERLGFVELTAWDPGYLHLDEGIPRSVGPASDVRPAARRTTMAHRILDVIAVGWAVSLVAAPVLA